jgi:DNA mismatch endonuclease, patch repair protein
MAKIRAKDTKPELVVRSIAHKLGFRYRLHRRDLPGSPDLVFPYLGKVIFVHGCYWHRHPNCHYAYSPKSNMSFWQSKFDANIARDRVAISELQKLGWHVIVIWECIGLYLCVGTWPFTHLSAPLLCLREYSFSARGQRSLLGIKKSVRQNQISLVMRNPATKIGAPGPIMLKKATNLAFCV